MKNKSDFFIFAKIEQRSGQIHHHLVENSRGAGGGEGKNDMRTKTAHDLGATTFTATSIY